MPPRIKQGSKRIKNAGLQKKTQDAPQKLYEQLLPTHQSEFLVESYGKLTQVLIRHVLSFVKILRTMVTIMEI